MKNTPVTEAHRAITESVCELLDSEEMVGPSPAERAAQLIADSEAKAKQSLLAAYDAVVVQRNRVTTERDQLRAELQRLDHEKPWLTETRLTAIAQRMRAEKAEGECLNLRADLDAIKAIRNEEKARAERAEAELADERARLDWFANYGDTCWHDQTMGVLRGEDGAEFYADSFRAAIDAAMKEETK